MATRLIFSTSSATSALNSSGLLVAASVPIERKRCFISSVDIAFTISALRRSTISFGRPAGPTTACQVETSKPGKPDSAMVGTSGAIAERFAVVTASGAQLARLHVRR